MTGPELAGRAGFDESFLGPATPLPVLSGAVVLPYTHFSVVFRPDRRLAAATAVGIDGAALRDVEREDAWRLDPRLPPAQQTGEDVYADNDLDRGHLVRRLDPVWGPADVAATAADDTFFLTNAAPQAAAFNQDRELWLGLEDYLLDHAADFDRRLVVLTGPVLAAGDPVYRGVALPLMFWKVAAFVADGALATTGYLLDQTPLVDDATVRRAEDPPPLGPYRTFQVPVASIATTTGLDLGPLPAADRLGVPAAREPGAPAEWPVDGARRLAAYTDIVLGNGPSSSTS